MYIVHDMSNTLQSQISQAQKCGLLSFWTTFVRRDGATEPLGASRGSGRAP